jgi:MFS family permease
VLRPIIGHTYDIVFVSRLVEGASVGFIFACIGPVLALWFPLKERGIAAGLMIGSLSAGAAIGVVASPAILASVGTWQATSAYLSLPALVGIVLALALTRKNPVAIPEVAKVAATSSGRGMSYMEAFKLPVTWLGSFIVFFNAWNMYVLLNIVPGYLAHPIGLNLGEIVAGKVSLSVTLAGVVGFILGGVIFDRVFKGYAKPSVLIGFLLGGIFTALILTPGVTGNMVLLIVVLLIAGVGIPLMSGALSAHVAMTYPPEIVGRMVGWWFGFGTIGGALGLFLGGMLIDMTGSFMWPIMLAVLVCVVGFILGLFLKKPACLL